MVYGALIMGIVHTRSMLLANRRFRRNLVLYGILYAFWTALLIATFWIPSSTFISVLWAGAWVLLVALIARSMLRMPSSIEIGRGELRIALIARVHMVRSEDIIALRYDRRDCRMRIVTAMRRYDLVDLSFDPEDLKRLEGVARSRGWLQGDLRGR